MKALAYRSIIIDSLTVQIDTSLEGDGSEANSLTVESAPRVDHDVYQIMLENGILRIHGLNFYGDEEEEVTYEHDLTSDPFAQPADLVEVYHDSSLYGKGTSMIPLSMKPIHGASITGKGTTTEPLSLINQHDETLGGDGSEASPIKVFSAPLADVAQSAIMLFDNNQSIYFGNDKLILNGKLADGTDFDYECPLTQNPFVSGIRLDLL
jgi:hypothetical protein